MTDLRRAKGKAPLDTKVPCAVCATPEPLATAHDHHRKPRAFGGTDDAENRVWLCASCHTRLHRVQDFLIQGNAASAFSLCDSIFPTKAEARSKLWQFANEAADAEKEVQGVFDSHRTDVRVTLTVDKDVWGAVKALAKEHRKSAKDFAAELLRRAVK